jgi:putative flippase GtrA
MGSTGRTPLGRQAIWFTAIGGLLTAAYFVLYVALRQLLGPQPANYLAWALTAIVDTAANRRLTFDAAERVGQGRAQVEGMLVFAVGLVLTSVSLAALAAAAPAAGEWLELAALGGANLLAGIVRFELLRRWVFAPERSCIAQA